MDFANLPLNDLAEHCAEETSKFRRAVENDTRYCYELMRRALNDNVSDALTFIYRIYGPLVQSWVYSHNRFAETGEHAEDFVSSALSTFYFAVRAKKFENFDHLGKLLVYLKLCTQTSISQYFRKQSRIQLESIESESDFGHTPNLGEQVDQEQLWKHIQAVFTDANDLLLIRCYFVYDLKPADISEQYPAIWKTARDVSVNLQRVRRTLRSDSELHNMLDID